VRRALEGGALYFAIVFTAGFLFGTIRTLWLTDEVGPAYAVLIELPLILLVSWIACGFSIRRSHVPRRTGPRLAMGLAAFLLLLIAEALVAMLLGGLSLAEHLASYREAGPRIGLAAQLVFALLPVLRRNL
jgi:hypothetical protein